MKKRVLIGCCLLMALMLIPFVTAQAAVLQVGPDWTGTHYTDIQSAVNAASAGDEIWVEQGTYTLAATIKIGKAISLYGGFTGSETSRAQRNWTTNVTTVDGNNSVRCFWVYSTITIDGFTITKASTSSDSSDGAGIRNGDSTQTPVVPGYLTLSNCILSNNNSGNSAGAILNEPTTTGTLTVNNCTFSGNTANSARAGAIANYGSDMTITNCTFSGNTANNGGAIYFPDTPAPSNTANNVITNCVFSNNTSSQDGGAIIGDANATVTGCVFNQNSASRYGTFAFYGDNGFSHVFTNCLFTGNTANYGAAICINGNKTLLGGLTVMNCTFAGNTLLTGGLGGAIYTRRTSLASGAIFAVTNCILWGNAGNEIDRPSGTTYPLPTVSYSDIDQTGYAGTISNSIDQDPQFVNPATGNYDIKGTSPCINTGTSVGAPANDIAGTTRPQGAGYDMGAYEYSLALDTTAITLASFSALPGNGSVTLTWVTETELDNAGFNIYRASADGIYEQINAEIIPAKGSATGGAVYEFVDNDVQNRQSYSYKLEDVDLDGAKTMHGPVTATPRFIYLFK